MKKATEIITIVLKYTAALILIQTLYYKFTAHPESVYIFSKLGLEPIGRIGSGILELIAAGLLVYRRTAWLGAALGLGLMSGAIFSHLTVLGVDVQGDGGLLFGLAVTIFICCLGTLYFHLNQISYLRKWFPRKINT